MKKRREKKDKLKASPNVETTSLFSIYVNFKNWLLSWLILVRKPSRWSEGPSEDALAEGLDPRKSFCLIKSVRQKITL
jgi:hypothetical protein